MATTQGRRNAVRTPAVTLGICSAALVATVLLSAPARASFMPTMDEFWIVKNGNEIFRDSFNGALPPSGPDDAITSSGNTYSVQGAGGMTSESGGKLTMTPALGDPTAITGTHADTFTGAIRILSSNPASHNYLGQDASGNSPSFQIHGLFDFVTPAISGESYGVRATDHVEGNPGKDVFSLFVGKSSVTGKIVVASRETDFSANTNDLVGVNSIDSFVASTVQVELIISKQANSDLLTTSFMLYDANKYNADGSVNTSANVIDSGALDNINDVTGNPVQIYTDIAYTKAQFFSTDANVPIPEPGTLLAFALGLAGLGFVRRRRRC